MTIRQCHNVVLTFPIILIVAIMAFNSSLSAGEDPAHAASCAAPEYRQFDFWVGDWDAFEGGSSFPVARVRVDRILDGCALHEDYRDPDGMKGDSFSIYDASRKVWH